MTLALLSLFFSTLLGGLVVIRQPTLTMSRLRLLLTFSAGYLLAITLLHLIPELFTSTVKPLHIGSCLMVGFFLQRFIESFSAGVEHGHTVTNASHCCIKNLKIFPLLSSITLHALLDGSILVHSDGQHMHAHEGLVVGMMLHKFLEAFALTSLLRGFTASISNQLIYLVCFSLASPLGFLLSSYLHYYLSTYVGIMLLAMVTGNFLYISATMLFEASPEHNASKVTTGISLLGAGLATLIEFLS